MIKNLSYRASIVQLINIEPLSSTGARTLGNLSLKYVLYLVYQTRVRVRTGAGAGTGTRGGRRRRLSMSSLCLPIRSIVLINLNRALSDIPPIKRPVKQLQSRDGLIKRHLMTSLVDPREREVAILAGFSILDSVHGHGGVSRGAELVSVRVVRGEGNSLSAKPVADIVCVAVDEGDADGQVEDFFEIVDEVGPDEVTGLLEGVVDGLAGGGVVEVHTDGLLDGVLLEVFAVVSWGAFALLICYGLVIW